MSSLCSHKGCPLDGIYPAPRHKDQPRPYLYFCLQHVREYNAQWDFFQDLDANGIECQIRNATVWERPTWPFGKGPVPNKTPHSHAKTQRENRTPPEILRCLSVLGLTAPSNLTAIKQRFRTLAKKFHPDANAGSRANIPAFHALQEAFGTLKTFYAKKA